MPLLAVEDGLDAVDAAIAGLGIVAEAGFVGAPQVRHVGPGLGLECELMLGDHGRAALGDGVDPVLCGKDAGRGCAVGGDADGYETRVGKEERAEAGPVLVGWAADCRVYGGDEPIEGSRRRTGWGGGGDFGLGGLGAKRGCKQSGEGEEDCKATHGGIVQNDRCDTMNTGIHSGGNCGYFNQARAGNLGSAGSVGC